MPFLYNLAPSSTEGIIQNGLLINLDASYNSSYPKSGTTWSNVAINAYNFTLRNTPTFQLINEGVFDFDGVNESADVGTTLSGGIPGGLTRFSLNVWFLLESVPAVGNANYTAIFTQIANTSRKINFTIGNINSDFDNNWYGGFFDGSSWVVAGGFGPSGGFLPVVNTWYNCCLTYDVTSQLLLFYLNGNLIKSSSGADINLGSGTFGNQGYRIARRWDGSVSSNFVNGKVAAVNLYNRALTADEVKFNYETLKGRFV